MVELIGIELRIAPNTVWAIITQDLDETLPFLTRTRPFNSSCRRACVVWSITLVAGDITFCGATICVVWRIHSGAGETHSIFYSSGMTHIFLRFIVNTLWRISSQKRFVVNTLWR